MRLIQYPQSQRKNIHSIVIIVYFAEAAHNSWDGSSLRTAFREAELSNRPNSDHLLKKTKNTD